MALPCSQPVIYVGLLGIAFFFLFVAFNGSQVLVTTLDKEVGFQTLMTLYAVFAFSNFFTPAMIDKLGHRMSMFFSAITYLLFIVAHLKPLPGLLFASSALLGIGAALLWSAQGAYLSRWSTGSNVGGLSGLFFALFMLNLVVGNLISGFILGSTVPLWVLWVVFSAIGGFGTVLMLTLRPAPAAAATNADSGDDSTSGAEGKLASPRVDSSASRARIMSLLLATLRLFADRRMLLFIPMMIFSGLTQEYYFGQFPPLIGAYNRSWIGYAMAAFGGMDVLGSIVSGRLSDRVGRLPVFVVMAAVQAAGLVLSVFAAPQRPALYFVAPVVMGVGDALLNTQIYAVLGTLFPGRQSEPAFALFKMMQAGFTAIAFLYGQHASSAICVVVLLCVGVVALVCVGVLGLRVASLDAKRDTTTTTTAAAAAVAADEGKSEESPLVV